MPIVVVVFPGKFAFGDAQPHIPTATVRAIPRPATNRAERSFFLVLIVSTSFCSALYTLACYKDAGAVLLVPLSCKRSLPSEEDQLRLLRLFINASNAQVQAGEDKQGVSEALALQRWPDGG